MNARHHDLSLYLVADTALCAGFGVAETVAAAIAAGVTAVQLRARDLTDNELVRLGRDLAGELRGSGRPLIVNDRVHLVGPIGADGAHIGQRDVDPWQARCQLGGSAILGLSVQTLDHVMAAGRYADGTIDYLGVGPVWPQRTKPDAAEPMGLDALGAIIAASRWPCVAIGGVTPERAGLLRHRGTAGIAVVSAVCGQPSVGAATRALREAWDAAAAPAGEPR